MISLTNYDSSEGEQGLVVIIYPDWNFVYDFICVEKMYPFLSIFIHLIYPYLWWFHGYSINIPFFAMMNHHVGPHVWCRGPCQLQRAFGAPRWKPWGKPSEATRWFFAWKNGGFSSSFCWFLLVSVGRWLDDWSATQRVWNITGVASGICCDMATG